MKTIKPTKTKKSLTDPNTEIFTGMQRRLKVEVKFHIFPGGYGSDDEDIILTFRLSEICEFHLMAPCGEVCLNLLSNVICGYKLL